SRKLPRLTSSKSPPIPTLVPSSTACHESTCGCWTARAASADCPPGSIRARSPPVLSNLAAQRPERNAKPESRSSSRLVPGEKVAACCEKEVADAFPRSPRPPSALPGAKGIPQGGGWCEPQRRGRDDSRSRRRIGMRKVDARSSLGRSRKAHQRRGLPEGQKSSRGR